jgi:Virulence factor BrkB
MRSCNQRRHDSCPHRLGGPPEGGVLLKILVTRLCLALRMPCHTDPSRAAGRFKRPSPPARDGHPAGSHSKSLAPQHVRPSAARNVRSDPISSRIRSLALLCMLGSALGRQSATLGPAAKAGVVLAALAFNTGAILVGFRVATARELRFRQIASGAVAAAIIWQLLQSFAAVYVTHIVSSAGKMYGVLALVLGLLTFLCLTSVTLVMWAEINAVRVDHRYRGHCSHLLPTTCR